VSSDGLRPALLIVEDDPGALRQLRWTFHDYALATASDAGSALEELQRERFPVVLLDLGLPPDPDGVSQGLALLGTLLVRAPESKVIVITGRGERESALKAIALGAYDFYRKPLDAEELLLLVQRAFALHQLEEENRSLMRAAQAEALPGVVAASEAMIRVCQLVERAAHSNISVLLVGESGTGKEVLARALHELSARAERPFVAINCAAIPESLLESELFGHESGAFTGAVRRSPGMLELAQGGMLFLDEVGDMPLALQPKLLRFLEKRVVQRVGGRVDIPVDAHIVSATHRDLRARAEEGTFREDLYYRLCALTIEIPPLRERLEDLVPLANHFFERFRIEARRPLRGFAPDVLPALARHAWPGNVRELENRMKRAVVMAEGPRLAVRDLDLPGGREEEEGGRTVTLQEALHEAQARALARAWAQSEGNVSQASRLLGVSRPTLYTLLRRHGIKD
jgi:two-component system NtrC family response regulator